MRYIGCKKLLLKDIEKVIEDNISSAESFCDIFSGTVTVANYFKPKYKIISNDILNFSYCLQKGIIENSSIPEFNSLKQHTGIENPIEYFNNTNKKEYEQLSEEKRFCQNNYSPKGKRMYMTDSNALKIDFIRNKINDWYKKSYISDNEYYYLISVLIQAVPFISNIAGTYGAFHKWWDKRALNNIELKNIEIINNQKNNIAYNQDANELINHISGDILYIDPPYNSRQYSPNYHVLETIALYDFPKLKGITGQRTENTKKSLYCNKTKVTQTFEELISKAKFGHIIVSYSNEGLMKVSEIEEILKKYGLKETYKMYEIPYRRFKSQNTSSIQQLKELLFYIGKKND